MKRFGLLVHTRGGSYLVGSLGSEKAIRSRIESVSKSINMSRLEVVPVQEERKAAIFGLATVIASGLLLGLCLKKKKCVKNSKKYTSTGN